MSPREPGQDITVILHGQHVKIPCNETVRKHIGHGLYFVCCDASSCDIGDVMTLQCGNVVVRVA